MDMKRETLTPAEQEAARRSDLTLWMGVLMLACTIGGLVTLGIVKHYEERQLNEEYQKQRQISYQTMDDESQDEARQRVKKYLEKHLPTYEQALAHLQALAQNGCEVPFEKCYLLSARAQVLEAMDREDIAFGVGGVTLDDIEKLTLQAEIRIASQKFAYLKASGGAKRPSDLKLLEEVCEHVYFYKQKIIPNHPTDAELKQLRPPGVTKVLWCYWGRN